MSNSSQMYEGRNDQMRCENEGLCSGEEEGMGQNAVRLERLTHEEKMTLREIALMSLIYGLSRCE